MLSKMITQNLIQLNVEARNWEDAIRKSAEPLIKVKKITNEYVNQIIQNNKEVGPYFVITKHTALPHARSKNGALKLAMGITTLKTPVISGNKENDPVKYLFCLSAPDNDSHLEALSSLVELLADEEFFNTLNNAKSSDEILDYIKNKE